MGPKGEIIYPPSPIFWSEGILRGRVYILKPPRGRTFIYMPPLFYMPPTPRTVFSPGVLRSKDFFALIFVVFRDFCKSYFWHPYFYRVFGYFRWFLVILVFLAIFDNFGDFGDFFRPARERDREKKERLRKEIVKERKKAREREKERKKESMKRRKGRQRDKRQWERRF